MKNIILISRQAAGKGAVVEKLKAKYKYESISTGILLREMTKSGTDLGKKVKALMDSGSFISDEMMNSIIKEKLIEIGDNHYVFDGFPRSLKQAKELELLLYSLNKKMPIVIYLDVTRKNALKRMSGRLVCPECKKVYSTDNKEFKPKRQGICDSCATALIKRSDDHEASIIQRLNSFELKTLPLVDYYKDNIYTVDANGTSEETFKEIEKFID